MPIVVTGNATVGDLEDHRKGGRAMPPRGTKKGTKRARQYEHIKDSLRERGESEDTAEEIAAAAVFLASDEARSIAGVTLKIDGGITIAGP